MKHKLFYCCVSVCKESNNTQARPNTQKYKSFAFACLYAVMWGVFYSPCSPSQLWGVIKQGYRCKGNYCAVCRAFLASLSLADCEYRAYILYWGDVHTVCCGEQVKWSYLWKVYCGFLCCILRAEPCNTWKKKKKSLQSEPQFFPLPRPSKDLRTICLHDGKHAKVWQLHLQNRVVFVEVSLRPVPVLTCGSSFWLAQIAGWTATSSARTRWRSSARRTPKWPAPLTVPHPAPRLLLWAHQRVGWGHLEQ